MQGKSKLLNNKKVQQKKQQLLRIIIIISFTLYLLVSLFFVLFGAINNDEGWYLYASQLVYIGQQPYKDFAFTQTPLLPYIYGLPQTSFFSSIYLGRITTVIFSTLSLLLSLLIAHRYGGEIASGITVLLSTTFTLGIYFQSITKTYALTELFFVLAIFVLSSKMNQWWKLNLATASVLLATLTRLSALFFAIPFIFYALITANSKNKLTILGLCFMAISWVLLLALPNVEAAKWGLLTHHTTQWGILSIRELAIQIIKQRIPILLIVFPSYFLLAVTIILIGYKQISSYLSQNPVILTATIGLVFFVLPNLTAGGFHTEYFVPLFFTLFPIIGILYTEIYRQKPSFRIILQAILLASMILGVLTGGSPFIDTSGNHLPVEEIRSISAIVAEYSKPEDKIFAIEALSVIVEANRKAMPNINLAQFSFYDGAINKANQLHLVNDQIILNYLENSIPKIVILTDLDQKILQKSDKYNLIITALENHYELQLTEINFGQNKNRIEVYIRRQPD